MANIVLKSESSEVLDSLWVPISSPSFHGSVSMENCNEEKTPWICFNQAEKKRRLSQDQVHLLEKSFEVENKLEPERKTQLAKELGLQARQVAIWFQNRRARYKTKVLEKEFGLLKMSYDELKVEYDTLFKENEKMKNEVNLLGEKLLKRKNEKEKAVESLEAQEEGVSSAKSDVLDSESPHYTTATVTEFQENEDEDDDDEDEDDNLCRSLMSSSACFPKLEFECCDDLQPNSCNLGFPVQDQGTWFWKF